MPVHGIWSWTLVVIAMPVDTVARAVLNPDDIHHVLDGMMRDVGKQELQVCQIYVPNLICVRNKRMHRMCFAMAHHE